MPTGPRGEVRAVTVRIYHSTTPLVPETDMAFVQDLFKKNNLSCADLEVWLLRRDVDSTGQPSPGRSFVFCNQFYRGLEISSSEVIFWFNNEGIYYYMVGELFTGITLDTIPGVSLKDAGMLFYRGIVGDRLYADSLRSFRSRGFNAELGIRDLNLGTNRAPSGIFYLWYCDREGKRQKISTGRRLKAGAKRKTPTGDAGRPYRRGRYPLK